MKLVDIKKDQFPLWKAMRQELYSSLDDQYHEFATDAELANDKAQNFYKKLGFEEVDRVVSFKIDLV